MAAGPIRGLTKMAVGGDIREAAPAGAASRYAPPTAIVVLVFWTAAASDWQDKGCTMTQGYGFAIGHGGWPDEHEGCEDEYGDPTYTAEYGRW